MSYELVEATLEHAPADLSAGERLVLVALAEWIRSPGGTTSRSAAEVSRRTGLRGSTLRDAYRRLAARGLEVRVPFEAADERGRPVFAARGRVTTFRLPDLPAPEGCGCGPCRRRADGTFAEKGAAVATERCRPGDERRRDSALKVPVDRRPTSTRSTGSTGHAVGRVADPLDPLDVPARGTDRWDGGPRYPRGEVRMDGFLPRPKAKAEPVESDDEFAKRMADRRRSTWNDTVAGIRGLPFPVEGPPPGTRARDYLEDDDIA